MASRAVFKLTLQRETRGRCPIVAELSSPAGLQRRTEGVWERVELLSLLQARPYGTLLGRGVFSDKIRDAFVAARGEFERLHVALVVEDDELRELRWERLCAPDGERWEFLGRDPRTPLSIHLASTTTRTFPSFGRRDLRALVLVASPPDLAEFRFAPFDAAAALRTVRDGLGDIPHEVLWEGPGAVGRPTLRALVERLTAERYTMLHVVCHGVFAGEQSAAQREPGAPPGETAILIEGEDGRTDPVEASRLLERLREVAALPHFVFLATCESAAPRAEGALGGLAHRLVRDLGIPAVVAMTEKISQTTALELGRAFYPRLLEHGEVDRALVESLAGLGERFDAAVPALFSRLEGRPLFSDDTSRPATATELGLALRDLGGVLPVRAPVLCGRFDELARRLAPLIERSGLSRERLDERERVLGELDALCEEVADINFAALARGTRPPDYDATCPFRGLQAFKVDDHRFFFGRDALIDQLERGLQAAPLAAIVGRSGSGKSSLAMAGIAARLHRTRPALKVVVMVPGSRPMTRLERALAGADLEDVFRRSEAGRVQRGQGPLARAEGPPVAPPAVLVVDQFDEAITTCKSADERTEFLDHLLALTRDLLVVVALRTDLLDELAAAHGEFHRVLQARRVDVEALEPKANQEAIEQQARVVGLRFEKGLLALLLGHVQSQPGAMPLVQHALLELWHRRHGRWLRVDEYERLGGVSGALAATVEAIYGEQRDQAERDRMRRIFMRLTQIDVRVGPDRRDRRRRVAIAELVPVGEAPEITRHVLDTLVERRLLVISVSPQSGRETVELSHDALIHSWPRLQAWIAEDIEDLRKIGALQEDANAWETAGRADERLALKDGVLQEIEALASTGRFPLNQIEADYLKACVGAREAARTRELAAAREALELERARVEKERQQARSLRKRVWIIAAVGLLALAAAVASGFLYVRAERALQQVEEKQRLADAAEQKAELGQAQARDAGLLAVIERLGGDSTRKGQVLREALSPSGDPQWASQLLFTANEPRARSGVDRASPFARQSPPPGRTGIVLDAAGGRLLALEQSGELTLRSVSGPSSLWTAAAPPDASDGSETMIPSPLGDGAFRLGQAPGFQAILDVRSPEIPIPLVEVFDVDARAGQPRALARVDGCPLALVSVDVSAGTSTSRCLLATDPDLTQALILSVADAIFYVTRGGEALLLPLQDAAAPHRVGAPRRPGGERGRVNRTPAVLDASRNEDGSRLVLVTRDQVEAWSVGPAGQTNLLPGSGRNFGRHPRLWGAVVDGEVPFVVDEGGVAWALVDGAWTIAAEFPSVPPRRPGQPFVHSTSAHALVVGTGPKLWVLDLVARRLRSMHGHTTTVTEVVVSADGRRFASADLDTVRVWDLDDDLGVIRRRAPLDPPLRLLDLAPDGRSVLVGGHGGAALWRLEGRRAPELIARDGVLDARFMPDGVAVGVRTEEGAGVWLAAGGLRVGATESAWDPARVFADPGRVFVDREALWGLSSDGVAFVTAPPGEPITGGAFSPGGKHLLLWRRVEGERIVRATLWTAAGESAELMSEKGPLAGQHVRELVWSPDGSRLLAAAAELDRVCAIHWPLADPSAPRRACVARAEVSEVTASPDPLDRFGLRGAAWNADASRIALVVGGGIVLLDAKGDAPPTWSESWSERWERVSLLFGPQGERIVETTESGVYIWPMGQVIAPPIKLVHFESSDPPEALATLPLRGGEELLTVTLRGGVLATRRWYVDPARAAESLTLDSPFCLEAPWRTEHLNEPAERARGRYCACRDALRLPDPTCEPGRD